MEKNDVLKMFCKSTTININEDIGYLKFNLNNDKS